VGLALSLPLCPSSSPLRNTRLAFTRDLQPCSSAPRELDESTPSSARASLTPLRVRGPSGPLRARASARRSPPDASLPARSLPTSHSKPRTRSPTRRRRIELVAVVSQTSLSVWFGIRGPCALAPLHRCAASLFPSSACAGGVCSRADPAQSPRRLTPTLSSEIGPSSSSSSAGLVRGARWRLRLVLLASHSAGRLYPVLRSRRLVARARGRRRRDTRTAPPLERISLSAQAASSPTRRAPGCITIGACQALRPPLSSTDPARKVFPATARVLLSRSTSSPPKPRRRPLALRRAARAAPRNRLLDVGPRLGPSYPPLHHSTRAGSLSPPLDSPTTSPHRRPPQPAPARRLPPLDRPPYTSSTWTVHPPATPRRPARRRPSTTVRRPISPSPPSRVLELTPASRRSLAVMLAAHPGVVLSGAGVRAVAVIDEAAEARLRRRFDLRLLPVVALIYLCVTFQSLPPSLGAARAVTTLLEKHALGP